ncbi:MAG: ParA family protein [Verrucomicrobiales bacterium]|nr:ParA family protein [Verrucomicrobiales bacterium]
MSIGNRFQKLSDIFFSPKVNWGISAAALIISAVYLVLPKQLTPPEWFEKFLTFTPNQKFAAFCFLAIWVIFSLFQRLVRLLIKPPIDRYKSATAKIKSDIQSAFSPDPKEPYRSIWFQVDPRENFKFLERSNRPCPAGKRPPVIVSMINLKGGVGKTTLSANLAGWLATGDQNLSVLLVDIDFQQSLTDYVLPGSLDNASAGSSSRLFDATTPNLHSISQELPGSLQKCKVIPAHQSLEYVDAFNQSLLAYENEECRFQFRSFFHNQDILHQFDVIIFDCPPRLTASTINALTCSDFYIIPTLPNGLSSHGVESMQRRVKFLQTERIKMPELAGIVLNRYNGNGPNEKIRQELSDDFGSHSLFQNGIVDSPHFSNFNVGELPPGGPVPSIGNQYINTNFTPFGLEFRDRVGI